MCHFSIAKLDSISIIGSFKCNARSKSIHPNVKKILSFQFEKFSPFKKGIQESLFVRLLTTTAITYNINNIII